MLLFIVAMNISRTNGYLPIYFAFREQPFFRRKVMNYRVEIVIWWLLVAIITIVFCYVVARLIKKHAPKSWRYKNDAHHLRVEVENTIDAVRFISLCLLLVCSILPVYPTYFSSPTVRITEQGDIIPLPYGAWRIPENDDYVRLRNTIFDCSRIVLQGRTEDGVYIENPGWFFIGEIKIVNYADFYHHYKTNGVRGLCDDIKAIITDEAWVGKTILPNSQQNIEASDKKLLALQQRLTIRFTNELPVKILIVSDGDQ
ncbi:MAG: hypothetical protein PHT88_04375 [Candidatus Moranbacteria bacterium]|nr:hypothetical protein [Candidatus Moranbacteria bacterium]